MRTFSRILGLFVLSTVLLTGAAFAQTGSETDNSAAKGLALFKEGKYPEAVPYLAVAAKANADVAEIRALYGVALLFASKQTDDQEQAKKMSALSLSELQAAKRLGYNDPQIDVFIGILTGTGAPAADASPARQSMDKAETFFAQSKYDDALIWYQKALDADPKLYEAALYMGDSYVAKQDWDNAEKAYQKAIAIDPARETAYRYSATPFIKQKKYDMARDRLIEAYITDPYNQRTAGGVSQWATATGAKLGHPKLDIPKIGDPASTGAWSAYAKTRQDWQKDKFAKAFPTEKTYRHSLAEEADALRAVLAAAKASKDANEQIQTLQKIESDGLLEAFVLLALADEGISNDHPAYLKDNRPKLRQYMLNYAIHK